MDNRSHSSHPFPIQICSPSIQPPSQQKSRKYRIFKDDSRNDLPDTKLIYQDAPGHLYGNHYERNQPIHRPHTNDSSQIKWSRNNIAMTMEYFEPISSTPKRYSTQSDYSYAYYEPGAVMHHSNIPKMTTDDQTTCTKSSPKSIRSLLSERNEDKPKPMDRHTYTTRYGTQENIYEDISAIRTKPTSKSSGQPVRAERTSKIEFQDTLHSHYRVLEELNLSVEEMFLSSMKKSNSLSPRKLWKRTINTRRNKAKGADVTSCKNVFDSSAKELVVAEDSGFSGSSSGASYVGSLRNIKTALTRSNRNSREIDNSINLNDCRTSQGSINVKVSNNYQKKSMQLMNQLKGDKCYGSSKGLRFPFWNKR